ncbi:hypothetical protein [Nitrosomonas ureae]|uniref:Uncharacterized protein n=1 Tax=Nitrosomonas ureae TaxID=44577 RepID=A0A1H5SBZ5_9PROT|nr:hypothetical protein [Nitrosomonas ureae]SEF47307.1 hypothetical protein SAMN05216334_10279 [Nitrosomonas ureae]
MIIIIDAVIIPALEVIPLIHAAKTSSHHSIVKNIQILRKNKHPVTGLPGNFLQNSMRAHLGNQLIGRLVADAAYF